MSTSAVTAMLEVIKYGNDRAESHADETTNSHIDCNQTMNENLWCSPNGDNESSAPGVSFKFLTYNVDQAVREENHEITKWVNRKSRVKSLIEKISPDIACLQEFKPLPGNETPEQFISNAFPQYRSWIDYRNPSTMAFGQVIMWNPDKFYPIQNIKRWFSDTPDILSDNWSLQKSRGYILTGIQFLSVDGGKAVSDKPSFWVFNTHFGLEEDLKTKSCEALVQLARTISGESPFIVSGDLNLFPDKNAIPQRAILTKYLKDLGEGALTSQKLIHVEGTFVGYEHDDFKADLGNMVSRLDHVLGSPETSAEDPILYTETMLAKEPSELTTRDTPSDHLPLGMTITLTSK